MGLSELLQAKRQEILAITAKHGAYNVRIFGSVARDVADEASDIDVLVDAGPETSPWFPAGLIIDWENSWVAMLMWSRKRLSIGILRMRC